VKLLFDQNLSHKLPVWLADIFPESNHVRAVGLERASDEVIWNHAKTYGFAIVTQDADYAERSRLFGAPPKVIWLRCGNTTPRNIERLIRAGAPAIEELGRDPDATVLELL
jgi:predicted nuclease of predicted toxin-antitoxin system